MGVMDSYRKELLKTISMLAQPWQKQKEYLNHLRVGVDELALEYDDLARLADVKRQAGELAENEYDVLRALDNLFNSMSGSKNTHLWTLDALRDRVEWEDVRCLARDMLTKMRYQ